MKEKKVTVRRDSIMVKELICDISEADFRKLDPIGKVSARELGGFGKLREVHIVDEIDGCLKAILEEGWESDLEDLKVPVTVAVHEPGDGLGGCYYDKFMNAYVGARSFQIGFGIPHLYSTRNRLEARNGDYWRVMKAETAVVYRVRLDPKWTESFVVKRRVRRVEWPFDELPDGVSPDYVTCELATMEEIGEGGSWKTVCRSCSADYGNGCRASIPVDADGKRIEPGWETE